MAYQKKNADNNGHNEVTNKSLPHNLDAEMCLIGCIMFDGEIASEVTDKLTDDDFYSVQNQFIFHAIKEIVLQNRTIDMVTVTDNLVRNGNLDRAGGAAYIMTVYNSVPSAANFRDYLDIVYRCGTMRRLIRSCSSIIESAYTTDNADNTIAAAEKMIFDINQNITSGDLEKISMSLGQVVERINTVKTDKNAFKGVMTGYWAFDNLTNGLHPGELIVLAARPAMGKSSFAMNVVENVAKKGKSCAVFSLEMPRTQIAQRLLCSCSGIPLSKAMTGDLTDSQWVDLFQTATNLEKFNIYVDDSSLVTPAQILSKCRRLKSRCGLDLVVIDYIQLMTTGKVNNENRQQEVAEISRSLKIMAKELNVPIIALSQMSRSIEARQGRPQLSDLRESGAIEQDADIVMFIHREMNEEGNVNNEDRELIIAKHRNGALDDIPLKWIGELVRFESINTIDSALKKQYEKLQKEKEKKKTDDAMSIVPNAEDKDKLKEIIKFDAPMELPDGVDINDIPPIDIPPEEENFDIPPDIPFIDEDSETHTQDIIDDDDIDENDLPF